MNDISNTSVESLFSSSTFYAARDLLFFQNDRGFSEDFLRLSLSKAITTNYGHLPHAAIPFVEEILKEEKTRQVYFPYPNGRSGLLAFPVENAKDYCLILAGGAYQCVATFQEGSSFVKPLQERGYSVFIVGYRYYGKHSYPLPFEDVSSALDIIENRANGFSLGANKGLLMGFSAGGHLAAGYLIPSIRGKLHEPTFNKVILSYPVVQLIDKTHYETRLNLLGERKDDVAFQKALSPTLQVNASFPKTFIWRAEDDPAVPVEGADRFVKRLNELGVPNMYKVYPGSGHGWGDGKGTSAEGWFPLALDYLEKD